jgi:hypothetical protein
MAFLRGKNMALSMILTGFLLASPAHAAEDQLDGYDANGDGKITFEEVMRHIEPSIRRGFDAMDRNKDGVLSDKDFDDVRAEMKKWEEWLNSLLQPFMIPEDRPHREHQGGGEVHRF